MPCSISLTNNPMINARALPRMYGYAGCGTCKKALKWLKERSIDVDVLPIREQPPTKRELYLALRQVPSLRALFNTSGGDYKSLALKDRIGTLSTDEAVDLLSGNGNLVKRPFVVMPDDRIVVGFDEAVYTNAFRR